jgi:hypothetical protein
MYYLNYQASVIRHISARTCVMLTVCCVISSKLVPVIKRYAVKKEVRMSLAFLTLAIDEGEWSASQTDHSIPAQEAG